MFVARKKRKENIAEYILYMFQVEDLVRAFKCDMGLLKSQLISRYDVDDEQLEEVTAWYKNIVVMMEKEGVEHSGHLQFLNNHINDLNDFHLKVLKEEVSPEYSASYGNNIGLINEFRLKGNASASDVEACINAIYAYLLLKIQNKEITSGTEQVMKQFARQLAILSKLYKDFEEGNLEL